MKAHLPEGAVYLFLAAMFVVMFLLGFSNSQ